MITFTDQAREAVLSYLGDGEGEIEALRISMRVTNPLTEPTFELTLVAMNERTDDERTVDAEGFSVLIKEADMERLEGATVDFVDRVNESGFQVRTAAGAGTKPDAPKGAPSGPIADRVREVLDAQVNPAIASHGGMISLVDVDKTDVFVEMSGGCQGCALSRMTLRQGVERMLREAVPELTAVHDVTDHSSGENPYL
ncbi:MAG: Fe-S biogenesis protein NfuA [Gemmatimonadales bacterium]|jgi:Fe/S biogenesis protein NfuA|nr:Fe-S biogenesis protein NfuA [Gemmatimonadales bacterium]MDG2241094.1 NifU family protein [Longimicrobiales bacterium]NCG32112.1 Fe-S biogenesis protein NfuA [Pseudomonadota bacterium]MBT3499176.1 Fe-S biogenesis protein NfuA [Gemmatimonadales bacterium]MBT3773547.1 Fe-S biogenesis protein NfuA [Gemmatimonadales bacterium]